MRLSRIVRHVAAFSLAVFFVALSLFLRRRCAGGSRMGVTTSQVANDKDTDSSADELGSPGGSRPKATAIASAVPHTWPTRSPPIPTMRRRTGTRARSARATIGRRSPLLPTQRAKPARSQSIATSVSMSRTPFKGKSRWRDGALGWACPVKQRSIGRWRCKPRRQRSRRTKSRRKLDSCDTVAP